MDNWIPLMEYAVKNGKSISTVRRHIKSGKLKYRLEAGKYFILDQTKQRARFEEKTNLVHTDEELNRAKQEIAELKMLVSVYEEQLGLQSCEGLD